MSSFKCDKCGTDILDTPTGYVTGCEHYPMEMKQMFLGKYILDGENNPVPCKSLEEYYAWQPATNHDGRSTREGK